MSVRVFSHRFFSTTTSIITEPLIGNEVIYSEDLAEPLIQTFSGVSMIPFYFTINYYYLQPKYTTSFNEFGLCIIVSDEVFAQHFNHDLFDLLHFTVTYQIPVVDIITLKRIDGDFPQDSSIDVLLTSYLESCSIVNKHQKITLSFQCNTHPFKNSITFEITEFTHHPHQPIENTFQDTLTTHLHPVGISVVVHSATDLVGLVANHEIKVDFMIEPIEPEKYELPTPQKALVELPAVEPPKGLSMTDKVFVPLTKEELRNIRLQKFS